MINPIQKNNISKINFNSKFQKPDDFIDIEQNENQTYIELPFDKLGVLKTFQTNQQTQHQKQPILPEYFINMEGYRNNRTWANSMAKVLLDTSEKISNKEDFDKILSHVCDKVKEINYLKYNCSELKGKFKTHFVLKEYGRGSEYWERYNKKLNDTNEFICPVSNEKYKEANTCAVAPLDRFSINIVYPCFRNSENSNLDLCKKAYDELISKKEPTEKEILETCATIQWLLYQESPFWNGNDSIANILAKSIMHSYDIALSPLKISTSLDFEAFDTDLDDYIKKYPTFFEKYPKKIRYKQ